MTEPGAGPEGLAGPEGSAIRGSRPETGSRVAAAQQALLDLAAAVAAALTPDAVLDRVAQAAARLSEDPLVHVWVASEDGRHLRLASQLGARPGSRAVPFAPVVGAGDGLAGAVARSREPLVIAALDTGSPLVDAAWVQDQGLVSFVGVPFAHGERLHGVLALFARRSHRFTRLEIDFLRSFGAHAAVALEGATLLAAATSRLRRLESLREIGREISQQRDPDRLLLSIGRRAVELLQGDSAAVYLLDVAAGLLRPQAVVNAPPWIQSVAIPLGQGVVGVAAERRQGMVVNEYPRSAYAIPPFRDLNHAVVAQPLLHGEAVHGVIVVNREAAGRPFAQADLVQLGDFAVQASIALENARLLRLASVRAERVKAAAEVGQLLATTRDADRILDLIAEKCREVLGAEAFGLFRADASGHLGYVRGFGLDEGFMREHRLAPGEGVVGRAVAERKMVETPDLLHDPSVTLSAGARARIERVGSRAIVAAPILTGDRVLGVLAVYHPVGFRIPAEEADFLETLASQAGAALENARLLAETQRRQRSAETLAAVTQALTASLDLGTVTSRVADAVRQLLDCDGGAIGLTGGDGVVRLAAQVGLGARAFAHVLPRAGEGVTGWVLQHGAPFHTIDYARDPRIAPTFADEVQRAGIASVLAVPVRLRDEVVGVLYAFHGRPVPITDGDVALAEDLARVVAVAVANARLYAETRRHAGRLERLNQVTRTVSASLRLEVVLDEIARAAATFFEAPLVTLWLADEGGRRLARRAGHGDPALLALIPERLAYGEAAAGLVAERRAPLLDVRVEAEPRVAARDAAMAAGIRYFDGMPILLGSQLLGVLAIGRAATRFLDEADRTLLDSLVGQAAVAIQNARLYEEARAHEDEARRAYEDLKAAQEQLVRTERLRALGEMASGVAHDFNNLLAAILGRAQLIQRRVEDPTLRQWLAVIERAALDGAQTVRQIQEFTRVRRDQPAETVDVAGVVRDAVELTRTRWRDETRARGIEVGVELDLQPVPPVDGQPAALRQALTNLIFNAVDALPRGGVIQIGTRLAGDRVEVCVADTGVGMPDAVRRRIFEPFFTTKGPRGTGLGLAMVYGVVSRHGGEVTVESAEGQGSTFTIGLPVGRARPQAPPPVPPALRADVPLRVLVIDDEPAVREALEQLLRLEGHEVTVAEDGAAGLERFRTGTADLVMTDLAMPGLSGWQVARAVKAARPEVPVVLVTGWGVELTPSELRDSGVDRVLAKPFRLADLQEIVASLREAL